MGVPTLVSLTHSSKPGADDAAAAWHRQPGACNSPSAAADVHAGCAASHTVGVCVCKAGVGVAVLAFVVVLGLVSFPGCRNHLPV